jgi:hypothetical protein
MKDFFGKELNVGDLIALIERSGSSSVYLRKGVVTGFTPRMLKVKFISQVGIETDSTRDPRNVIKE